MSKKNKNRPSYKPVEIRELQQDINPEQKVLNPFTIVGDCKPSKTGKSLAMRIRCSDGLIHDYTILKTELERLFFWDGEGELIPASIREYHNPLRE